MASSIASSIASPNSSAISSFLRKPISQNLILSPFSASFPLRRTRLCAIKIKSDGGGAVRSTQETADLLRKPTTMPLDVNEEEEPEKEYSDDGDTWVDWEDLILAATVPLVGFVRMILQSGKYESGDRLSPEHERTILERLLPYHPDSERKIGSGIDYITIGYHPNFVSSRCLFIVRKDGELVDFSYWKCIRGLIRQKYPLHAETFILRHFRNRRRSD